MKKRTLVTAVVLALGVSSGAALAAQINNLNGQTCSAGFSGTWHFVNNQTGGAGPGVFQGNWSSGDSCITGPSKVNSSTQHFICTASGELTGAFTNLPGRLVLSDFTCTDTKEPPCDPKKDPTCK